MRLKLDIRELRTFRTKHTINDLKTKKTITQSLCDLPFNEANRGNCFFWGGGGGAEGNGVLRWDKTFPPLLGHVVY